MSLTLGELERLEAERKLRSIPAVILDSTWVLHAQEEAVIDAVLLATTAGDNRAYAHARHTGEWAARIATELPGSPAAEFMRRCGVLADANPAALERIREVRDCTRVVRAFQHMRLGGDASPDVVVPALIIAIADEFDLRIFEDLDAERYSPNNALRIMQRSAEARTTPIVQALLRAVRNGPAFRLVPAA